MNASILMVKNHESSFISFELCSPNKIPTLQFKKLLGFLYQLLQCFYQKNRDISIKEKDSQSGRDPSQPAIDKKVPCIHHFHA